MLRDRAAVGVSRRDMLKTVGVAVAAMSMRPSSAATTEKKTGKPGEKARKDIKLAIFTGIYSDLPLEDAARRIKEDGFGGVVLQYDFQDTRFDPSAPDWQVLKKITACFERHEIRIAGLFGYHNVVDPDLARGKRGNEQMALLIKHWKRFGSPIIATETGTYNAESPFAESPENNTEKAYVACRSAFEKLAKAAEKTGAIIAIEPYWRNIIDSAERAERLFREIKSPALKLVMDPCNYFRKEDLARMKPIIEDIFKRVGSETVIAHAKDVKASEHGGEFPGAGLGVLDYPLYLSLLAGLNKELYLVIEHVKMPDAARARDYVKGQMEKI